MDIQLLNINKQFNNKVMLKDLNVTFKEGKINCLMGASGIGKTTVINILLGLITPDSGEVIGINGKHMAAVFQEDRLIEHWNALQNIKLTSENTVTDEQVIQELQALGLKEHLDKPVRSFSGGMRRRVAIVRAILAGSDLLVLDEPFQGLDDTLKKQVIEYIKHNSEGKTVIVVTHEANDVNLLEANLITLS